MRTVADALAAIGISLVLASPMAWLMSRFLASTEDPVIQRQAAIGRRFVGPLLKVGLVVLAASGIALLVALLLEPNTA